VTWRQVVHVIERHDGKESLELIPALTSLGKSYLFVSPAEYDYQPEVSSSSGETYLRRANRIADSNPDSNWEIVEATLLSLGDYYILSGRPNRASKVYQETWDLLSDGDAPQRLKHREETLETANLLQHAFPPKYYNSAREVSAQPPPDSFETGTMSFIYTVSATGRITSLKHVETLPRQIDDFTQVVGRSLRRMIYRPRIEERKMVPTHEVIYTHEFFYRPQDLPAIAPDPAAESPAPEG